MRFALLFVVSSAGFAQPQDALTLLRDVADSARTAASWRIEGSIEEVIDGEQLFPASFTLAMKSSGAVKFVQNNGERPGITACNQATSFGYSASLHRFTLGSPPDRSVCGPLTGDWEGLPTRLISPKLGEYRKNGIAGRTPACQIIQGEMLPDPPVTGWIKRTICIDTNRNLIVWDKSEGPRDTKTWTYTRIETNPDLTPQDLAFDLPEGSVRTMFDIPTPHHPGELVVPRYAGVVMPRVRSRVDPHFDSRGKKPGGLGRVTLYVVIGTDGRPADVAVLRSSMPSALAAEVVRAVSQWRYYPATKDGQPVTVMSTVYWTVNM
jgi:TonB family protein